MIPGLKIEFIPYDEMPDVSREFIVDKNSRCYWLEGGDQIFVVPNNPIISPCHIKDCAILVSFNFMKSLDPDGGQEWLDKKLKLLIKSLIKNRKHILD